MKRPLDHTETAPDLVRPRSADSSELATPPIGFDDTVVKPAPIEVVRTHRPLVAPVLLLLSSLVISGGLVAWGAARGSDYAPLAPFRMDPIRIPRDSALDFEPLARPRAPQDTPPPSPPSEPRPSASAEPRRSPSAEPRRPSPEPRRSTPAKSPPPAPSPTAAAPAPTPSASPSPTGSGALNIVVRQGGRSIPATIYVDGHLVGQAPLQHVTTVGLHEIQANGLGQVIKRSVEVAPNASVRVAIDLPD